MAKSGEQNSHPRATGKARRVRTPLVNCKAILRVSDQCVPRIQRWLHGSVARGIRAPPRELFRGRPDRTRTGWAISCLACSLKEDIERSLGLDCPRKLRAR